MHIQDVYLTLKVAEETVTSSSSSAQTWRLAAVCLWVGELTKHHHEASSSSSVSLGFTGWRVHPFCDVVNVSYVRPLFRVRVDAGINQLAHLPANNKSTAYITMHPLVNKTDQITIHNTDKSSVMCLLPLRCPQNGQHFFPTQIHVYIMHDCITLSQQRQIIDFKYSSDKKERERKEYLYSAIYITHSLKELRYRSHRFTCILHDACLSFVSVHQIAPPLTKEANIQLQLTTHLPTPKG